MFKNFERLYSFQIESNTEVTINSIEISNICTALINLYLLVSNSLCDTDTHRIATTSITPEHSIAISHQHSSLHCHKWVMTVMNPIHPCGLDCAVFYVPANTLYNRLCGRRFLQVKTPNQQHQTTVGKSTKEKIRQRKQPNTHMHKQ